MILGGGSTIDFLPPMLDVFLRMKWMERDRQVLGTSVNMCHPWNDHPALGWSTAVVTNRDTALAERLADELAERCWEKRHRQPPRFATPEEAIRKARDARLARKLGVVMMADASDVVTAGAPGENTALLERLLEDGGGMVCARSVFRRDRITNLFTAAKRPPAPHGRRNADGLSEGFAAHLLFRPASGPSNPA